MLVSIFVSDVAETDAPVSIINRCGCCVIELKVEDLSKYNICLVISVDASNDAEVRNSRWRLP